MDLKPIMSELKKLRKKRILNKGVFDSNSSTNRKFQNN